MDYSKQVRDALNEHAGASEVMEVVSRFYVVRNGHELAVEVCDTGDVNDHSRYTVSVTLDGERVGRGNGGRTIQGAFDTYQWGTLDREVDELVKRK